MPTADGHIDLTSDLDVLFGTIDGEAENQGPVGWVAVGWSIVNRVKLAAEKPYLSNGTVRGTCLMPEQYDCWMPGPDHDRIMALNLNGLTPYQKGIMQVAQEILKGTVADSTNGATHYFAREINAPSWVSGARFCGLFGSQLFWKGVR